ncbi:transporter [Helicobacter enhydrae]|uniref:Probable queuosine precursor transporter n=1 Tax=Helicobacter enhydrae TaxID=222136 RepID=A0A1B1U4X1_9HELI|nr:queuosine precursor transporter [Helicobacter enhydrae]ANV97837.1 transporter [Helicobacter enhydrae]
MSNEILLILSVLLTYSALLALHQWCGKEGLVGFMVFASIVANIEVMILVRAFGIEQTLGNVLFASTFLITDVLSEIYGKESAKRVVKIGIFANALFLIFSQLWLFYTMQDVQNLQHFESIFANTPRIIIASLLVFAIASYVDVWLYHFWWDLSERIWHNRSRGLWLRNNGSTLISQLLNTLLFSFGAFYGIYPLDVILQIALSSYLIFFILSVLDTPILYLFVYLTKTKTLYD